MSESDTEALLLSVTVDVEDLLSLTLTTDCVVDRAPPTRLELMLGDRIIRLDGERVTDRAEIRGVLLGTQQRAAGAAREVLVEVLRSAKAVEAVMATSESMGFVTLIDFRASDDATHRSAASVSSRTLPQYLDTSGTVSEDSQVDEGARFRAKIGQEVDRTTPDRCIVGLCEKTTAYSINPLEQLQILARQRGVLEPVVVDGRAKLRERLSLDAFATLFKKAMKNGHWFFFVKATKSINLLSLLGSLVEEMREHHLESVHPDARIIISTEPHPHFPASLLEGAVTLRVKPSDTDVLSMTSISLSASARKLAFGQPEAKHRVRLATHVDVVAIDPRDVTHDPTSPPIPFQLGSATLVLQNVFQGLTGEKLYNLNFAGESNRFAISTAFGNVYILDDEGSSMVAFHAHDSAVWDVSFSSAFEVVTAGEDGLGVWWSRDAVHPDSLICTDVVRQPNDVYAVRHTSSGRAVGLGGYLPHVLIRGAITTPGVAPASAEVLMPTAVQAMCNLEGSELLLCGGSDGTVTTIDAAAGTIVSCTPQHRKKCPCISSTGPHTVVSGSYEGTVKVWDIRNNTSSSHVIKFKQDALVTGVAASGNFIGACVGESLHVWDRRNLATSLGSVVQAWRGASRGLVIDEAAMMMVSASTDGLVRYWSFGVEPQGAASP